MKIVDEFAGLMLDRPPVSDDFGDLLPPAADNGAVALDLAQRGFAVFPVRDWGDGDDWKPVAKWPDVATADLTKVSNWWKRWPEARVGLAAGQRNNLTVLDIDRKNGKDGVATLSQLGFPDVAEMSPYRVRTPSGGWHLFFAYDERLKNSASKIGAGIDVRAEAGFVLAPGSYKDGKRYQIEGQPLARDSHPQFPEALVPHDRPDSSAPTDNIVATPELCKWAAERLETSAKDLAETPDGQRNHALNNAVMWAAGAAAHGLLTRDAVELRLWSAADAVGVKKREFNATFRSAWKGGTNKPLTSVPRAENTEANEFDDLPADVDSVASDPVTARLNVRHAVVVVKGRTLITTERADGSVDFGQVRDLHAYYENDRVGAADGKREPVSRRWMRNVGRRSFPNGVTFAPAGEPAGTLNLWRGWGVEADAEASCDLFLRHVRETICAGIAEHSDYIIGWLAHMVQHPGEKPGVGVVLRGGKGAGKDTVAEYVARMIGRRHAPTVAQSDHIVGKFNARLENALLLHVQEGSWAGDHKAESVLKYLVTSDRIEIERKGIDSINLPSVLRLFISANADWVVPASPDERRWAVFEVSSKRRGDAAYFSALRAEMDGSGPAALLHYLRAYDLQGFNVRAAPETEGLRDQKIATLRNIDLWWFEILSRGEMICNFDADDAWATTTAVSCDWLRGRYVEWMKGRRYDGGTIEERHFGRRLRDLVPGTELRRPRPRDGGARSRHYLLPSLGDCREAFEAWIHAKIDWDATD